MMGPLILAGLGVLVVLYGLLWYVMFIAGEIGQAMSPGYTWKEALAGGVSETIYVPLATWITARLARLMEVRR